MIEVQAHTVLAPLLQIAPQVAFLPRQNNGARLLTQAGNHGWHDEIGQVMAHGTPQRECHPFPPVHVVRGAVDVQQVPQLIGNAVRAMAAKGLIHQGNGQLFARRIRHHAGQTRGLFLLRRSLFLSGGA